MNLDDELHRLFTDDRLDVPARGDAEATIVAGARRIRRRRMTVAAAGGAAAVAALVGGAVVLAGAVGAQSLPPASSPASVTPTAESQAPPVRQPATPPPASPQVASGTRTIVKTPGATTPKPPPKVTMEPNGYAGLRLGMTAEQAEATGVLVPNAQPLSSRGCKGYDYKGSPNQPNHYSVLVSDTYGVVRIGGRADAVTTEGLGVGAAESEMKRIYPTSAGAHGAVGEWVTAVPKNPNARYWIILRNQAVSEIRIELAVQDCYA